jgi:hypothetical protein
MSGSLVQLVAKGPQDVYLSDNIGTSFFKMKYSRHTNFAQVPKRLDFTGTVQNNGTSIIKIQSLGDLINHVWLEGDLLFIENDVSKLSGTTFDLYIGGQKVDSQTYDYMADIWQVYMAETFTKCQLINNNISQSDNNFFPLHFFFCDNGMFLPLVNIQYHQIEIRITWGPYIEDVENLVAYGSYVYLDTKEREEMVAKTTSDILITQVQRFETSQNPNNIDLSTFNHPVKSIYFGFPQVDQENSWTFNSADILLNGNYLLEKMSPSYFHTVQGYYGSKYGIINFDSVNKTPKYTQYFTYNFCLDVTSYPSTGTCNFSRLDTSQLSLSGATKSNLIVYAVNYNILRIKSGLAGILFSN